MAYFRLSCLPLFTLKEQSFPTLHNTISESCIHDSSVLLFSHNHGYTQIIQQVMHDSSISVPFGITSNPYPSNRHTMTSIAHLFRI